MFGLLGETAAHILYIIDHQVHIGQVFRGRFSFFSIKGNDRYASGGIFFIGDLYSRTCLAAKSMFRTEDLYDIYSSCHHRIHPMLFTNDGCRVSQDGNTFSLQVIDVLFCLVGSRNDRVFFILGETAGKAQQKNNGQ